MAKVRLTSSRGKFTSSKHPRGAKGRFTSTPDQPKKVTVRRKKRDNNITDEVKVAQLEVRRTKKVNSERLRVIAELPSAKRKRVLTTISRLKPSVQDVEVPKVGLKTLKKPKVSETARRVLELNKRIDKATKAAGKQRKESIKNAKKDSLAKKLAKRVVKRREQGLPPPASPYTYKESLEISGKVKNPKKARADLRKPVGRDKLDLSSGKVEVWSGTEYGKYKGNFKERVDRNFKYQVKVDGEVLTLNKQTRVMVYKGEVVKGVPSMNARLRELPPEKLVSDMATNMKYVEAWDNSNVAAPAPRWDVVHMGGKVPDKFVPVKGYGGMELHHINQWSDRMFSDVREDVDSGKLSLEDAKKEMRGMLTPNPNVKQGYEIKVPEQSKRAYVVLPAGLHNFNEGQKLYKANHPDGIHPDTGELTGFGLPDKKNGSEFGEVHGRQYHDTVRDGFWSEYRRREVLILRGELNRRLQKGEITAEQVQELWNASIDRQEKSIKESRRGTNLS